MNADVGIRGSTVAAIGEGLDRGKKEIDARGRLVPARLASTAIATIEQLSASGLMNADTFESATTRPAFGGQPTTVISFAAQACRHEPEDRGGRVSPVCQRGAVVGLRVPHDPRRSARGGAGQGSAAAGEGRSRLAESCS